MQVFDGATQGMNANAYVAVVTQGRRDMVIVTARAPVRMRILGNFGVPDIELRADAFAELTYGISGEGQ